MDDRKFIRKLHNKRMGETTQFNILVGAFIDKHFASRKSPKMHKQEATISNLSTEDGQMKEESSAEVKIFTPFFTITKSYNFNDYSFSWVDEEKQTSGNLDNEWQEEMLNCLAPKDAALYRKGLKLYQEEQDKNNKKSDEGENE